jgi:Ca2+-binding RTX toxin-like protein
LIGGKGNDTYIVDTGDVVIENPAEGTDTVQSSVTYTLGANLETSPC